MQQQQDLLILGTAIRELRKHHGLTSNLATATGVTPAHITALENGQLDPDYELLLELAQSMGIRPSAFFLRAEELDSQGTEQRTDHE